MVPSLKRKSSINWELIKSTLWSSSSKRPAGQAEAEAETEAEAEAEAEANAAARPPPGGREAIATYSEQVAMVKEAFAMLSDMMATMNWKEEVLPLMESLQKCDSGMITYQGLNEVVIDHGAKEKGKEGEKEKEGKKRSKQADAEASDMEDGGGVGALRRKCSFTLQDAHRYIGKAKFNFGMYGFFLPWTGSMALAGLGVAAACLAFFPVWMSFEAGFYMYLSEKRKRLLRIDKNNPIPREECIRHLKCIQQSLLDLSKSSHPDLSTTFFSDWFSGACASQITRSDALQWMSVSFMFRDYDALETEEEKAIVEEATDCVEKLLKHEKLYGPKYAFNVDREGKEKRLEVLKPGFNICGHYETTHYPFCIYVGIHLFKKLVSVMIKSLGFERHVLDVMIDDENNFRNKKHKKEQVNSQFTYWLKKASVSGKGAKETNPIVFFHGIGTGISSYGVFLKALTSAYPNSSIMVVELPLVAMERPWGENWAATSTAGAETLCGPLVEVLSKHNIEHPVIMGHSFGCFACRWVLNFEPLAKTIRGCVLLDPMVFLLPFPDISKRLQAPCHNFYQFLVRRLIMREPSVAYALNRKSKWPKCCLWEEDLKRLKLSNKDLKFDVTLSKQDCFFDTNMVSSYLNKAKSSCPWLDYKTYDCTHGEVIFRPDLLSSLVPSLSHIIHNT